MRIVIDIPEEIYEMLVYTKNTRPYDLSKGDRLILDGTPLPKAVEHLLPKAESEDKE